MKFQHGKKLQTKAIIKAELRIRYQSQDELYETFY